jgi:hypothetical protein
MHTPVRIVTIEIIPCSSGKSRKAGYLEPWVHSSTGEWLPGIATDGNSGLKGTVLSELSGTRIWR